MVRFGVCHKFIWKTYSEMWALKCWDKKGQTGAVPPEACPPAVLGCTHVRAHSWGEAVTERYSARCMNDFPLEIPMCISSVYKTSYPRWDAFSKGYIFQRPTSASLSCIQRHLSNSGTDKVKETIITLVKHHHLTPDPWSQGVLCAWLRAIQRVSVNICDCKELKVTFPFLGLWQMFSPWKTC